MTFEHRPLAAAVRRATSRRLVGRIRSGPGRGLRIGRERASADYRSGTNELPVQLAVADLARPGSVVYDIGANVGFFSLLAARSVGEAGVVYAFEPVPANVAAIEENTARNGFTNVFALSLAVGDEERTATLYLDEHPGGATLSRDDAATGATAMEVRVASVDELVASGTCRAPALVKIDVEGEEIAVLRGMDATLERSRPTVICEVDAADAAAAEAKARAVAQHLELHGYEVERLPDSYVDASWEVIHLLGRA